MIIITEKEIRTVKRTRSKMNNLHDGLDNLIKEL